MMKQGLTDSNHCLHHVLIITTGQVQENADILLGFPDTSTILHASLLLCEHCTSFCNRVLLLYVVIFFSSDCLFYVSFILAILQLINYVSIVLIVLLCFIFWMYSLHFRLLSSTLYLIFIIPALCSCVTVLYRCLSVFVFTAFAGDY